MLDIFIQVLELSVQALMVIIAVSVFTQRTETRTKIAFIFAFMIGSHNAYFHSFSGNIDMFYISAGILDLIVILIISTMKESPRLAGDIQNISLVSIGFNGLGWLLFVSGQYDVTYRGLFVVLYAWAFITLIRGEPENNGYFEVDSRLFAIHRNVCKRNMLNTGK